MQFLGHILRYPQTIQFPKDLRCWYSGNTCRSRRPTFRWEITSPLKDNREVDKSWSRTSFAHRHPPWPGYEYNRGQQQERHCTDFLPACSLVHRKNYHTGFPYPKTLCRPFILYLLLLFVVALAFVCKYLQSKVNKRMPKWTITFLLLFHSFPAIVEP